MRTPVPDYLDEILDTLRDDGSGSVADDIPALKAANPDLFVVALTTAAGRTYSSGDCDVEFSIQSMSKPFAYTAALADRGEQFVTSRVGVEPSGEAFNELSPEPGSHRPKNPMINPGAIKTHHLFVDSGTSRQARVDSFTDVGRRMVLEGMRRLSLDGLAVGLKDPDGVLPEPDLSDGTFPFVPID